MVKFIEKNVTDIDFTYWMHYYLHSWVFCTSRFILSYLSCSGEAKNCLKRKNNTSPIECSRRAWTGSNKEFNGSPTVQPQKLTTITHFSPIYFAFTRSSRIHVHIWKINKFNSAMNLSTISCITFVISSFTSVVKCRGSYICFCNIIINEDILKDLFLFLSLFSFLSNMEIEQPIS